MSLPVVAPVIRLRSVHFRWRRDRPLVLDIDAFDVDRGERVFVVGASGSGKSTLLSLIGGVVTPERGSVEVLGRDMARQSGRARDAFRADHIGFVFQLFNLIPYLTVIENVTLPCRFSRRRRDRIGDGGAGALAREAQRLLGQLDMTDGGLLGRPVTELSVGQQQRVAAARALIGRPELVVADEPTSALDMDRRESFLRLVESECQAQGSTLLFVSHDRTLEPLFDRTIDLTRSNAAASPADSQPSP